MMKKLEDYDDDEDYDEDEDYDDDEDDDDDDDDAMGDDPLDAGSFPPEESGSSSTLAVDSPLSDPDDPDDPDDVDEEFNEEARKRKDKQIVDTILSKRKTNESVTVEKLTDLLLQGEQDKLVYELSPYCSSNSDIKKAKQLLREARDHAKARITRLSGVASLTLDELRDEYED